MRFFAGLGALLAFATVAHARWIVRTQESAFSDIGLTFAATFSLDGAIIGLRCTNANNLEFIYAVKDKLDSVDQFNAMSPKLKVRVDKNLVLELPAFLELGSDDTIKFISHPQPRLVDEVASSHNRLAVMVEVLGMQMHEREFDVVGAERALSELRTACKLAPAL